MAWSDEPTRNTAGGNVVSLYSAHSKLSGHETPLKWILCVVYQYVIVFVVKFRVFVFLSPGIFLLTIFSPRPSV